MKCKPNHVNRTINAISVLSIDLMFVQDHYSEAKRERPVNKKRVAFLAGQIKKLKLEIRQLNKTLPRPTHNHR
jgi:hypothetical protein